MKKTIKIIMNKKKMKIYYQNNSKNLCLKLEA